MVNTCLTREENAWRLYAEASAECRKASVDKSFDDEWRNLSKLTKKCVNEALGEKMRYRRSEQLRIQNWAIESVIEGEQDAYFSYTQEISEEAENNYWSKINFPNEIAKAAQKDSCPWCLKYTERGNHDGLQFAYTVLQTLKFTGNS